MNQLKDHILILGAGLMQRPAIQSARKLGLKVTVIDANPNAMCIPLADNFEPVDLKPAAIGSKISPAFLAKLLPAPFTAADLITLAPLDAPQATAQPSSKPSETTLKPFKTFLNAVGVCSSSIKVSNSLI